MAWFRHKNADSLDPQYLLAQAEAQTAAQTEAQTVQPSRADRLPRSGFRLTVQDVFTIRGRGTVVTGQVEAGSIANGATVRQTRVDGTTRDIEVIGIEKFRKILDAASAGDNVGLLLRDVGREDIGAGDVLTA